MLGERFRIEVLRQAPAVRERLQVVESVVPQLVRLCFRFRKSGLWTPFTSLDC